MDTYIVLHSNPQAGFPEEHILGALVKGKCYKVVGTYCKSQAIIDDSGKKVWVSNNLFKKYFKKWTKQLMLLAE